MKPKDKAPNGQEWGNLRSFLAQQGMSQAEIDTAIGKGIGGRKREKIEQRLTPYLQMKGQ